MKAVIIAEKKKRRQVMDIPPPSLADSVRHLHVHSPFHQGHCNVINFKICVVIFILTLRHWPPYVNVRQIDPDYFSQIQI